MPNRRSTPLVFAATASLFVAAIFVTLAKPISVGALRPPSDFGVGAGGASINTPTSAAASAQQQPPQRQFGYYGDNEGGQSFEERAAEWRRSQQERYDHQTPAQRESALDEDGRTKLLASVSRGSIAMFFFVLMWRAVHHYELADASFKGPFRLMMVVPTVALFVGNMSGCVASLTSPSHSAKKRMKAILNLNKLVEILLFAYNLSRLTMFTSKFVPREIYVGRTLTNFLFLVQCQLFTRVTWGAAQAGHEAAAATGGPAAWSEEVSQGGAASYVSSTGAEATTAKGYGHSSGYEPSEAQQAGVSSQRQYEEGGEEWT